jgi:hypothetical protein
MDGLCAGVAASIHLRSACVFEWPDAGSLAAAVLGASTGFCAGILSPPRFYGRRRATFLILMANWSQTAVEHANHNSAWLAPLRF